MPIPDRNATRKAATFILGLLQMPFYSLAGDAKQGAVRALPHSEVVMSPGMKITATTPVGTISITAVDDITRSYTWDGATRAVELSPRAARFFGSLGLFHNARGEHWREHQGITRCSAEEGHQDFATVDDAMKWSKELGWMTYVYTDNGLMVGWNKIADGKLLIVKVWQVLIGGKKPERLPGSQNDKISVETVVTETDPLVKAVAANDLRAVKELLEKGADANARNCVATPVLFTAVRRGWAPIVDALLKRGASPNVRDIDTDSTPLLESLERRDIIRLLLAAGADVNAARRKEDDLLSGLTPLMLAAYSGTEELVQLLIDNGADVNAKTARGDTAFSLAKEAGTVDGDRVVRKLEAAGAKR